MVVIILYTLWLDLEVHQDYQYQNMQLYLIVMMNQKNVQQVIAILTKNLLVQEF